MAKLTHIDDQGRASMVDVGDKSIIRREAVAEAVLRAQPPTIEALIEGAGPKGEALAVARIAGIQAAKRCDELIPLCHTLPIDAASVSFERAGDDAIRIETRVTTHARTGVEMEALTAAAMAALTLYDMGKAIDAGIVVERVRLVEKVKGR